MNDETYTYRKSWTYFDNNGVTDQLPPGQRIVAVLAYERDKALVLIESRVKQPRVTEFRDDILGRLHG